MSSSIDEYFFFHYDKLKVRARCINELFEQPVYKLCGYIRKAISHPNSHGVKLMVIVGGFSESRMLKEFLQEEFPDVKIYIPNEPSLAVMKGSLIYGHNPSVIAQRIANFTYGCVPIFEFEKDEGFTSFGTEETPLCKGPFDKLVEIGTVLLIGEPQVVRKYHKPVEAKFVSFFIYGSDWKNPTDVSDKSCFYLGNITMKYENFERDAGTVQLEMLFSGPVINITLKDLNSKRSEKVTVNARSKSFCIRCYCVDNSELKDVIENHNIGFPVAAPLPNDNRNIPYFILGDDTFHLRTWLMKPFARRTLTNCHDSRRALLSQ
ncbi:heat shock 70 kDa protein 12B-like [Saccostrea cucullata]|uniref:heat shock 70 kDa protein 12B-like n=1 Tax=Saccostrea cuccullata TaxID=36930 RepID=UPI002ED1890C